MPAPAPFKEVFPERDRECEPEALRQIDMRSFTAALERCRRPFHKRYLAMYSSLLDAIVTDPVLMLVPADDHMVHRGDGVFETCKCVNGALYNLDAHLQRLEHSALAVGISWPGGMDAVRRIVLATARVARRPDAAVRVLLARGPGGFGVNPYESPEPALYVIVTEGTTPYMLLHTAGARVRRSTIPAKPALFAGVKNCNYLPNVLMKKEAVDWGVDFVVGFDADGHLTEGPTENMGIVTSSGELRFPRRAHILSGTTMLRVAELVQEALKPHGPPLAVVFDDIDMSMIKAASEAIIVGTSCNVVAVCEFEGHPIGKGRPGPAWLRLSELLEADMTGNRLLRTEVVGDGVPSGD